MKIIVKFLLRNIKEKKLRTILILLSVTLSTALLFATLAISGTVEKMYTDQMKRYTGHAEIRIQADAQNQMDPFFIMKDEENDKLDFLVGVIQDNAVYKTENGSLPVALLGYQYEDLMKMFDITYEKEGKEAFDNRLAIISSGAASKYHLSIGSDFDIYVKGEKQTFKVHSIAENKGLFNFDGTSMTVVVPRMTLASIYDVHENQVNNIFAKTKDSKDLKDEMKSLTDDYPGLVVKSTITKDQLAESVKSITSSFSIMLISVIFISIFIINTSFKVITYERLPMVGTFRSIGATKKMTNRILLGESFLYGLIGGILGCTLGFGILKIMINSLAYNPYTGVKAKVDMVFGFDQLLFALLFAIVLSIISAYLPIRKISKIPVRNIVLNNIRQIIEKNRIKTIVGIILIIIPIVLMQVDLGKPSMGVGAIFIITVTMGVIFLIPPISNLFIYILEKVSGFIFGNEGLLAAKNIRNNKNIVNNMTLLTIGIAGLLMINTLTGSVADAVTGAYSDADFQISFYHPKADDEVMTKLTQVDGVDEAYGIYQMTDVKIKEKNDYFNFVWGIDPDKYFNYWKSNIVGDEEQVIQDFKGGRTLIVSNILKEKYNLKVGDQLTLNMKGINTPYTVVGFMNSLMNNGTVVFIPEEYMKQDAKMNYRSLIMIKTSQDAKIVSDNIKKAFEQEYVNVSLLKDEYKSNLEVNNQMFSILQGFSILTMVIGIFGVFNNFVVSLISRKRSIAIYRSVGMNRKQVLKMLLIEAGVSGLVGGIMGVLGGMLFIMNAEYIMKAMFIPLSLNMTPTLALTALTSGLLISLIAAILPTIKTSKQSIIDAIKYE